LNPHPLEVRRLYRASDVRLVAGVASGMARHLRISTVSVRVAFIVLTALSGLGALLYAVFWAVLPPDPSVVAGRRDRLQLLAFAAVATGVILLEVLVRRDWHAMLGWLVAIVAVGAGIIWHQADPRRRQRLGGEGRWQRTLLDSDRRSYLIRFIAGGTLVIVGIIGILLFFSPAADTGMNTIGFGLLYALLALAGVGVVTAPVLWRMVGALRAEREARIREQERAELAAMIHDQVLHTLALIQRNAGDVKAVLRLARGQERTLRNWLYKSTASPAERFAAAVEEAAAEVEDTYAIAVETVVVGDLDVDDRVRAVVAAAREALVNAARHAKVSTVSLYAEVEPDAINVFVRDRGAGFDMSTVEDDRHGVRGSIIGRMQRHGGRAEIRSEPGSGTEVRLTMPRPGDSRRSTGGRNEP
jgi:signal transduction histidine kinase